MKKKFILICCVIITSINAFSQNGKFKNMTPQDRAKTYTELMQTYLNLNRDQTIKVLDINLKSANEMEKLKSVAISKMDKWNKAMKIQKQRETLFKSVLSKVQMDKYITKKKELLHKLQN